MSLEGVVGMYSCTLKIFVMSTSKSAADEIADLFRNAKPPEDCICHLETAGFGDPCDIGTDSAVIIDRNPEYLHRYRRVGGERVVFLTSAGNLAELDSDTLSAVDDLWILTGRQKNDENLLKVYVSKLQKTMKESSDRRKMEICFHTVIDSLPDLVWFKDNDGAHLIVNNEFCTVVEKTKQQIYKKHHNYIWDVPEDDDKNGEAVCRQSEEVVVKARKTCQFEEKITTRDGMRQLVTYKSPLIDVDGTIFGTCGMGHDITDLQNVTKELRIVIDSIPFGVAIVDSSGSMIAVNKFLQHVFPDAVDSVGHSFEEWNSKLPKEKICTDQGENEYRIFMGGQEHIMRFREEPIVDIFGENIGHIQFIRDVTIKYNFEQQNLRYANTDFLTGLNNRRSLFDYLNGLGENTMLSLIMMDLDRFKSVNDTYGHAAGDKALELTSRVLEEYFPDGINTRLGGDEFLVALVGEYDLQQVEQRTQQLLDALREHYMLHEEFQTLSASAGVVQERLPVCDIQSIENLIRRGDRALYNAKESGKARYCVNC
jgi:diguanylate cyclase (GGDEF)-like protein/PAS domain S-box-containing protein